MGLVAGCRRNRAIVLVLASIFFVSVAFIFFGSGALQGANLLWENSYGGGRAEMANSLRRTADGGIVVVGFTESYGSGGQNMYVVRVDKDGEAVWATTYGEVANEVGWSIAECAGGGYVITGTTTIATGRSLCVLGLDDTGKLVWDKMFEDLDGWRSQIIWDQDDGFLVTAQAKNNTQEGIQGFALLMIDAEGSVLWRREYRSTTIMAVWSIASCSDGGWVVAGSLAGPVVFRKEVPFLTTHALVVRIDAEGEVVWQKTYGLGEFCSIVEAADGYGYIAAGRARGSKESVYVVKVGLEGEKIWEKTFSPKHHSWASTIATTSSGAYLVGGTAVSRKGDADLYLAQLNNDGKELWSAAFPAFEREGASTEGVQFTCIAESEPGIQLASVSSSRGDFCLLALST